MLITLTTDFGTADHFVGAMKGVMLSIAPRVRIVDITHEIPPFDVAGASFAISEAWNCFPKGTVHVVVVDPGVGSERRPILVEAGGHFFIGPDNGVFSMIYDSMRPKVREISNPKLMRKEISRTFHGRDVFAPAAAHLARKTPPARFGKLLHDYIRSSIAPPTRTLAGWSGTILKVDRFGNLITNFDAHRFEEIKTRPFEMCVGSQTVRRLALTYSEVEIGEVFVIVGSSGFLEIAANQDSAACKLGCSSGAPVQLAFGL